jgi:hypothetical protein
VRMSWSGWRRDGLKRLHRAPGGCAHDLAEVVDAERLGQHRSRDADVGEAPPPVEREAADVGGPYMAELELRVETLPWEAP